MNESGEMDAALGDLADHPSRGSQSIDRQVLVELMTRCGLNQTQAAEFFAVSGPAVSKALKRMQVAVARNIPVQQAGQQLARARHPDHVFNYALLYVN